MIWPGWPCKWGNGKWPTSGGVAKYQLFSQAKPTQALSWCVCSQRFRICIKSPKYCTLTVLMKVELPSCLSLSDVYWLSCLWHYMPLSAFPSGWTGCSVKICQLSWLQTYRKASFTLVGFSWTKYANLYIAKIEKNITSRLVSGTCEKWDLWEDP